MPYCLTNGVQFILGQEWKKPYILCSAALMLTLFAEYQTIETVKEEKIIDEQGAIYENYMKQLEGPYTQHTYESLKEMQQEFIPLRKAMYAAQHNIQYEGADGIRFDILLPKMNVFEQKILCGVLPYIEETPNAYFVYETGWERMFSFRGNSDLKNTLWVGLLSSLCFAGLFAFEKKGGIQRIIMAAPLGRRHTLKCKLIVSSVGAVCICLLSWLPRLVYVIQYYGLPQSFAPAMSLQKFQTVPVWIPLIGVLLYSLLGVW